MKIKSLNDGQVFEVSEAEGQAWLASRTFVRVRALTEDNGVSELPEDEPHIVQKLKDKAEPMKRKRKLRRRVYRRRDMQAEQD